MASDEDYIAFLEKANKDRDEALEHGKRQSEIAAASAAAPEKRPFKALDEDQPIPVPLLLQTKIRDRFYVSDADEPFETVSLRWAGAEHTLPDEGKS